MSKTQKAQVVTLWAGKSRPLRHKIAIGGDAALGQQVHLDGSAPFYAGIHPHSVTAQIIGEMRQPGTSYWPLRQHIVEGLWLIGTGSKYRQSQHSHRKYKQDNSFHKQNTKSSAH
ncbi:MAG: hypothetical protein D6B26_05270 [Spirochaetaceae bacterium]|nr:MAG: hypothetical protein D6B26_05270 [Spirochaetaceae bacterium]